MNAKHDRNVQFSFALMGCTGDFGSFWSYFSRKNSLLDSGPLRHCHYVTFQVHHVPYRHILTVSLHDCFFFAFLVLKQKYSFKNVPWFICSWKVVKILINYLRRSHCLVRSQAVDLQLCWRINSISGIFWKICWKFWDSVTVLFSSTPFSSRIVSGDSPFHKISTPWN